MNELLNIVLTPLETDGAALCAAVRQRFGLTRLDTDQGELYALKEALQDFPAEYPPGWWQDPQQCRWWLCLHVDWKAYDEVAWQVQTICRTLGLETRFVSEAETQWNDYFESLAHQRSAERAFGNPDSPSGSVRLRQRVGGLIGSVQRLFRGKAVVPAPPPPSDTPTMDVLSDASEWVQQYGYELLFLATGGDEYLAVPVRLDLLAGAIAEAERLNLPTFLA